MGAVFRLIDNVGGGHCGDMIFSGHMVHVLITSYMIVTCLTRLRADVKWRRELVVSGVMLCSAACLLQVFMIVQSRIHYTVDIVLALFFSVLMASHSGMREFSYAIAMKLSGESEDLPRTTEFTRLELDDIDI